MKKKILIVGNGFMAQRLAPELKAEICPDRITSYKDAERVLAIYRPNILINGIGSTGLRNVDDCEKDVDKTLQANTFVPIWLAEACLRYETKFVHIGSGCVFHYAYGFDQPVTEDRMPDFTDLFYSRSKMYTDRALEALMGQHKILITRIRIPLDDRPHPKNILTKLLKFHRVIDIPNTITYVPDFIRALKHLIKIDACGIYNVVNRGGAEYLKLLDAYKRLQPDYYYETMPLNQLPLVRTNMLMSTKKLEKAGFPVRHIKDVYKECVKNYLKAK